MRVLIVGCGYVGLPLGIELVGQGHEVVGLRRSSAHESELVAGGLKPLCDDITRPEDLAKLPPSFDWVVNAVSSTKGGADEYRAVYLHGTHNLLEWLRAAPPKKFVYTSSTSVYGQNDGSLAEETSPAEPARRTTRRLVEAEQLLLEAAPTPQFPAIIHRVAVIYPPAPRPL